MADEKPAADATDAAPSSEGGASYQAPSSILIIGAGVFGLSTALALARRPEFAGVGRLTVLDRSPEPGVFPARDAASVDSSRIVRADYADAAYSELASEALARWRETGSGSSALGAEGRYSESGLLLAADDVAGDGASTRPDGKPTGLGYVKSSWVNALALAQAEGRPLSSVKLLPTRETIARYCESTVGGGAGWADWGYLNECAGWADAEACMAWLYDQVVATGRVEFVNGTAARLLTTTTTDDGPRVTGAVLRGGGEDGDEGRVLSADLVIVAAGAWTPSLVDLSAQAVATGQVLGYLRLTADEERRLRDMPVLLNLTSGCFAIPPRGGVLKVARHAYGYLNPVPAAPAALGADGGRAPSGASGASGASAGQKRTVSQPYTHLDDPDLEVPAEGLADLRAALRRMIPWPSLADRPFSHTRLCWYTDTPTGDWIVDYHPAFLASRSLFVATGGSGHAFKFLPVLGDRVADCLVGRCPPQFRDKWRWRGGGGGGGGDDVGGSSAAAVAAAAAKADGREDGEALELAISTEDGSRGGRPGLILRQEMERR
ncbi:FAD dependent oxidoreductase [Xylariaceae sp. FL0804]|nr:FAD dependent oxidoreductase [Xylariaceae sp. FL0804]